MEFVPGCRVMEKRYNQVCVVTGNCGQVSNFYGVRMSFEHSVVVINVCCAFVIVLDRYSRGAATRVIIPLAGGSAVALVKWHRK